MGQCPTEREVHSVSKRVVMLRTILLISLLCLSVPVAAPKLPPIEIVVDTTHHFEHIYRYIREHIEGNYVWHPADRGSETYGGISRRLHRDWFGWQYIDQAKPLRRNDVVPEAEFWVLDFYLGIWVSEGFEEIDDYDLALNLFDFRIHSGPRTVQRLTNRVLDQVGLDTVRVGTNWVDDRFNRVNPTEFILRLKIQRLILFNRIVQRHPSQKVFYNGWVRRIEDI